MDGSAEGDNDAVGNEVVEGNEEDDGNKVGCEDDDGSDDSVGAIVGRKLVFGDGVVDDDGKYGMEKETVSMYRNPPPCPITNSPPCPITSPSNVML